MSPVTYISVNCEQHACRKCKKAALKNKEKNLNYTLESFLENLPVVL